MASRPECRPGRAGPREVRPSTARSNQRLGRLLGLPARVVVRVTSPAPDDVVRLDRAAGAHVPKDRLEGAATREPRIGPSVVTPSARAADITYHEVDSPWL